MIYVVDIKVNGGAYTHYRCTRNLMFRKVAVRA